MPESVDAWWTRRQWSKGLDVPYAIGQFRTEWQRYPVLVRQFHPDLNRGITLSQVPPGAEVYLQWQCDAGHQFVATPDEQRHRPGHSRRRSTWCPECAAGAVRPRTPNPRRAGEPTLFSPAVHAPPRAESPGGGGKAAPPGPDRRGTPRGKAAPPGPDRRGTPHAVAAPPGPDRRGTPHAAAAPPGPDRRGTPHGKAAPPGFAPRETTGLASSPGRTRGSEATRQRPPLACGHALSSGGTRAARGPDRCRVCDNAQAGAALVAPGSAFVSRWAPRPSSRAEADLRQRVAARLNVDLSPNAVRVAKPFFAHLEVWPDLVIGELLVAIEFDTTGRDGLEHVGGREATDRRKDRLLRAVGWEVVRIRCGNLQPIGPFDLVAPGVSAVLIDRVVDRLGEIRGELMVASYAAAG